MTRTHRVLIVGGGFSGLAIAWHLQRHCGLAPAELAVLEATARTGGNIASLHKDGWVLEAGPNGFLDNAPATLSLVDDLGLTHQLLPSNQASAKRFIWRAGKLRRISAHPGAFLASGILPLPGVLRVALEPFVPAKRDNAPESVFDFARRRIGRHAAELMVDAMVSGVFAGNARELELASAFPNMAAMERQYGGLFRAMWAKKRAARRQQIARAKIGGPEGPAGKLTSFREGFETLPQALALHLNDSIVTGADVTDLARIDGQYRLTTSDGRHWQAPSVVLACPAQAAARISAALHPGLSTELDAIPTAPITVVALAFRAADLPGLPDGFGFLAPRHQELRMLGCLWSSSIFAHRAPPGGVLLQAMFGGAHSPNTAHLPSDTLAAWAQEELATAMRIAHPPQWTHVFRHPLGIAQYPLGHRARMKRIRATLTSDLPGLHIAGSAYDGISVNHCATEAPKVAQAVAQEMRRLTTESN